MATKETARVLSEYGPVNVRVETPSILTRSMTGKFAYHYQDGPNSVELRLTDNAVDQRGDRFYIKMGFSGFNTPANNGNGYATKAAAEKTILRYQNREGNVAHLMRLAMKRRPAPLDLSKPIAFVCGVVCGVVIVLFAWSGLAAVARWVLS